MSDFLKGKVAIISGSGRGIGRGIAMEFARNGASVVVNDPGVNMDGSGQDLGPADSVVKEIRAAGGKAVGNYESVATMQGGESLVKTALDNFGRLDIVVTPHGILRDRMIFNMTEAEWDDVIKVHLKGTFCIAKPASALFKKQGSGRFIAFSSISGLIGNTGQANYGAAKDGIAGLVRVMARDLGGFGVTVNAISPAALTRMTASISDSARELRQSRGISGGTGLVPYYGEPDDIAPFVTWLASDRSSNVNGQIFHCVGGIVSHMNTPQPIKTMQKQSRWTIDELAQIFPITIGADLVNPAPPPAAPLAPK